MNLGIALSLYLLTSASPDAVIAAGFATQSGDPVYVASTSAGKPTHAELAERYKTHSRIRNMIASKLTIYWQQEREITGERDRMGRQGDMAMVILYDQELAKTRAIIDDLRAQLTHENQILTSIDQADTR